MKFWKPAVCGLMAGLLSYLSTRVSAYYAVVLLLSSVPFWLLFIVYAIQAAKPE